MIIDKMYKRTLANGLTVLVIPQQHIPKVSVQLWYNVGSKDEKSHQKGLAHLIEHMIFKGTQKLSESDINLITRKLSGYCNAFTSHDYTGYLFDFPSQHWQEAMPMMADCMRNCTFQEELLNSEMKAVIQELKMYNDDYASTLIEKMLSLIFEDHPYHYPIIGYKRDLWNLKREELLAFYHEHYVPNNAVLVVTGDVTAEEVFAAAEHHFAAIAPNFSYKKEQFHHTPDIEATSVEIRRDVQQALVMVAWVVPGMKEKQDYTLDMMSWILGAGKGSRLFKKVVDELELTTDIESFVYDLFDHSLFFIQFQPKDGVSSEKIIDVIMQEVNDITRNGVTEEELTRAIKKTDMDTFTLKESNQKLAYLMGKYFIALGDENYLATYNEVPREGLGEKVQAMVATHLRPTLMHQGAILPLPNEEKKYWVALQELSDKEDEMVLSRITREVEVEEGVQVEHVHVHEPKPFSFPRAQIFELPNGLKVLWHHRPGLPKIDVVLDFKAKNYFDPEEKQGLSVFLFDMLQEGTKKYSSQQFAQELEQNGMSLSTFPGHATLSMLSSDARKGLGILAEMVNNPLFDDFYIEKVRSRIAADVVDFWDEPSQFAGQLVREKIYAGHPYSRRLLGTTESVIALTKQDILDAYKQWIVPQGSRIALVGDLSKYDVEELLASTLGSWQGVKTPEIVFPVLAGTELATEYNFAINRDQVSLCFGRLSVERKHPDFDKLLLFDQVFTGGILGSMSSRLFSLRERSGLFYTIGGSLLAGSGMQPGMLFLKTIVSNDRLAEAERQIKNVIAEGATGLTQEEHHEAQRALINSLVDNFGSNAQIATTFLFVDLFDLPADYFDHRVEALMAVTREETIEATARLLRPEKLVTVRIGRL